MQWALAVGGSIWAAACFLFYVPDRIEYQLFLVTMLLGAVVSGLVTLAVYLPAYLAFVTPFVGATVIRYGLEGDPLHWGIALAAIVTLFLFINFARYIQNAFVESLRLRMALAERNSELAERNREVERANLAKSRFLAAASHDLRQPLHALNLFAAQLGDQTDPAERARLVARIDAAIESMNELFNALLDISKLDAGVLAPDIAEFPVGHLLGRIETTFAATAREKGLRLGVVPSRAWVRSDAILLERILLNLVSNAIRYTSRGGVIVGCRRRGDSVRIEVWDSGIGVAEDQQRNIFGEFYQVGAPASGERAGLGLGLSIVDGLCRLLGHPIDLASRPGKGSRFAVAVPRAAAHQRPAEPAVTFDAIANPARDKLIVVIDDDALVLDGMRGLLQGWGCRVVAAGSGDAALAGLASAPGTPEPHHLGLSAGERENRRRCHRTAARGVRRADSRLPHQRRHHERAHARRRRPRPAAAAQAGKSYGLAVDGQSAAARRPLNLPELPAPRRRGEHRLGAVRHPQRLQDGGDVVLHRRFGEVEPAADRLVALALHHQRQHVDLPFGQSQIGRRRLRLGRRRSAARRRRFGALAGTEDLRRNIDAAGEHQVQRARHHLASGGLRDEAQGAVIERLHHVGAVGKARQDDHRDAGVALAQLGEERQPVAVRQTEIEQDQGDVGLIGKQLHRACGVRRLEHRGIGLQFSEEATQGFADQHMIVDDEDLHRNVPREAQDLVARSLQAAECTSVPGRKHEADV